MSQEPGKKSLGVRDLAVGAHYLHRNGHSVRRILSIQGSDVFWDDAIGPSRCSRQTFVRACTSKASDEAVKAAGLPEISTVIARSQALADVVRRLTGLAGPLIVGAHTEF